MPAAVKAWRKDCTSLGLERGELSCNRNNGPVRDGLMARYPSVAATGQRTSPVAPKCSVVPAPNGSALLRFKWTDSLVGDTCESTAISCGVSISGVNASMEGHVNSPDLINPKNPMQKAAHSIVLSESGGSSDHAL